MQTNNCVKIDTFINMLGCSPIHVQYSTNCFQCNILSLGTNITKVLYIHYSLSLVLIGDFKIRVVVSVLHFVRLSFGCKPLAFKFSNEAFYSVHVLCPCIFTVLWTYCPCYSIISDFLLFQIDCRGNWGRSLLCLYWQVSRNLIGFWSGKIVSQIQIHILDIF